MKTVEKKSARIIAVKPVPQTIGLFSPFTVPHTIFDGIIMEV